MKIRSALFSISLCISVITITLPMLSPMPKAHEDDSDEENESATPTATPEKKSAEAATPDVPNTQFSTIELEKESKKSIVTISHPKNVEELARLFDESKKLHDEMAEVISNLEEMRSNLAQSFYSTADKLDTILQETSVQAGTISSNLLTTKQQNAQKHQRKK